MTVPYSALPQPLASTLPFSLRECGPPAPSNMACHHLPFGDWFVPSAWCPPGSAGWCSWLGSLSFLRLNRVPVYGGSHSVDGFVPWWTFWLFLPVSSGGLYFCEGRHTNLSKDPTYNLRGVYPEVQESEKSYGNSLLNFFRIWYTLFTS